MTEPSAVGLVAAAGVIGITHAVEPDHVAGIAALTEGTNDRRLSAVVGACFATGHVLLVIGWIAVATLLVDASTFPQTIESVGLVIVGIALTGFGTLLGVSAARRLAHRHEHRHSGTWHTHWHLHGLGNLLSREHLSGDLATTAALASDPHHSNGDGNHRERASDHEHTVTEYLVAGTVGALFTLSPPLSMIAFVSIVLTSAPAAIVGAVLLTYAAGITLTMSFIGLGAGSVSRLARSKGPRVYAVLQLAVAGIVLAVAVSLLVDQVPVLMDW